MVWKDKSSFSGEYYKGQKDGYGKFIFPSGKQFEGFWVEGKQDGVGVIRDENRELKKRGKWKNGTF